MRIDYASLHGANASASETGVFSFDPMLAQWVGALAAITEATAIVDLRTGDARFRDTIEELGIPVRAFDVRADESRKIEALDLAEPVPDPFESRLRGELKEGWLTTCLGAFERLDPADLPVALHNLSRLTDKFCLVAVNCRPSIGWNRHHACILPWETWQRLFTRAGFVSAEMPPPPPRERVLEGSILDPTVRDWLSINPFRAEAPYHSSYILLRRAEKLPSLEHFTKLFFGEFPWLRASPWLVHERSTAAPFLIAHIACMQDFHTLLPVVAGVPRETVRFIVRDPTLGANHNHMNAIDVFLRNHGFDTAVYSDQLRGLDGLPGDKPALLVCASESVTWQGHVLSSALVAEARVRGIATALLQHGIWVEEDRPVPTGVTSEEPMHVSIISEEILSWGTEHQHALWNMGVRSGPRYSVTGCPKYDLFTRPAAPLDMVLGPWVNAWEKCAILTSSLHWSLHGEPAPGLFRDIIGLIERHPEWLFLWKQHPAEASLQWPSDLPPNLQLLNDLNLLAMHLPLQTLIANANALVTTLSTALLDAAVAGKPSVTLASGNRASYVGIEPIAASEIRLPSSATQHPAFLSHYYERPLDGQATARTLDRMCDLASEHRPRASKYHAIARIGAFYSEALAHRAAKASETQMTPSDDALCFPFSSPVMSGDYGDIRSEITLTTGNRDCRAISNGFILHPNRPGQTPPTLTYKHLNIGRFSKLSMNVSTGHRSPGGVLRLRIEGTGTRQAIEEVVSLQPGLAKEVRLDVTGFETADLTISAELAPNAASNNWSAIEIRNPRLAD